MTGFDASSFHQPRHTVLTAGETSIDKVSHYARRTICAIAGVVAILDCLEELGILALMSTRRPPKLIVKTTA
jgi:hypothetical protein